MRKILLIILSPVVILILLGIYLGFASYFTTLILIVYLIILLKNKPKSEISGIRIAFIVSLVSLLGIETILYGIGTYKNAMEKNTVAFTDTMFFQERRENLRCMIYKCCAWYKTRNFNHSEMFSTQEFAFEHSYNEFGLRNSSLSNIEKKRNIICLGDSFTEGVGAPQDSTYPKLLEGLIYDHNNEKTDVVNAGVGGSDIVFMYKLFEDQLLEFEPKCLIILLNSSDIIDLELRGGNERFQPNCKLKYSYNPTLAALYNGLYTVRHISHDLFGLNYSLKKSKNEAGTTELVLGIIEESLTDFKSLCQSNDIELVVALNPFEHEDRSNSNLYTATSEFLNTNGFHLVDLFETFDNTPGKADLFWPIDGHCNSDGYSLMSKEIFSHMVEVGCI